MNILMSNISLVRPSGSEVWTYTVSKKLAELGASVTIFTTDIGPFAEKFRHAVIVKDPPQGVWRIGQACSNEPFDFAILNHTTCVHACATVPVYGERIRVIHGTRPHEEQPENRLCTKYVAVSPEVARYIETTYGLVVDNIIYNPVNAKFFDISKPYRPPKTVLWACHKGGMQFPSVVAYEPITQHKMSMLHYSSQDFPTEWMFEKADIVVGEARSIYQAIAAGRPVILSNGWTTCGVLTPEMYKKILDYNCTVRCPTFPAIPLNYNNFGQQLDEAAKMPEEELAELKQLAEIHRVDHVVNALLELAGAISPTPPVG